MGRARGNYYITTSHSQKVGSFMCENIIGLMKGALMKVWDVDHPDLWTPQY